MRPRRLEMEGFAAFRELTVVDFEGADLFALVGPTGAGKSSIVDAICFALYGIVPRYDDQRLVARAISEGLVEAKVRFDFTVGEEAYSAVRVVRAQPRGGATTKEARLVRSDGAVLAGTAPELTAAVEDLLGLTYAHFTTCVVLPQGEFTRFLNAKPRDRQALIVELLDMGLYGSMRGLAKEREAAARARHELVERQIAELAPRADEAELRLLRAEVDELVDLIAEVDRTQPALDDLAARAAEAGSRASASLGAAALLRSLQAPEGLEDHAARAEAARESAGASNRQRELAAAARAASEARLAAMPDGGTLEAQASSWAALETLRGRIGHGEEVVERCRTTYRTAASAQQDARRRLETAELALDHARRDHAAMELASTLTAGDACPVCGAVVAELATHDAPELGQAEAAVVSARRDVSDADGSATSAQSDLASAEALLSSLVEQAAELAGKLSAAPAAAAVADLLSERARLAAEARAAAEEEAKATERARSAAAALAEVEGEEERWRSSLSAKRDELARLSPPTLERLPVADAWEQLLAWAAARAPELAAQAATDTSESVKLSDEAQHLASSVVGRAEAAGVSAGDGLLRDALVERLALRRGAAESVNAALESLRRLESERQEVATAASVAAEMSRHLAAPGFERWVLDSVMRDLVAAASEVLLELSGGAYALVVDEKGSGFGVVDNSNAGAVRSSRTLSGGETFLASLALALALAEQVAQLGAGSQVRLESMFLDEGFGTLDASTLDTVAAAIEELGAGGRVVGLISHVPELAERLPVRFEVAKGPRTSTVERIDR